ncbi:cyclic nucleotide-binding protein [Cellvibrio sp. BR]|uniref:Crp/Fnr family transcriptional regulator n=1 Tax=unclassified Cellvibrio TaxID=2624793 RepID=UPI0002600EC9|nr:MULTISPECIES: Crp/Fnr family transcriptional regulator [unclassified Cellvibrio]EIK46545.1 cyclic nucleotide-binding protein [Cellvibrio sp. BR]QEY11429.1 Crp/Fnr family transcriptional regulator [Cellvibrio sp. KY-YJ-3]
MSATADAFNELKKTMESYAPISPETWAALVTICKFRTLSKHQVLYALGEIPPSFSFVYSGLFRSFITDEKGAEYNKNFFYEGTFPGSMVALLRHTPSAFTIVALEPAQIIEIDFPAYRALLLQRDDLKLFQIYYLERNWLLAKDAREIAIVQEDATQRYLRFMREYPFLLERLSQHHIASHLGITPTQLSRIRKKL